MNLFQLAENYLTMRDMMLDQDMDEDAVKDTLEAIDCAIEEKADGIAYVIKELDAQAEMLKAEADRLKEKARAIVNNKDRLREYLTSAMVRVDKLKFSTGKHSFSVRKSAYLIITDEDAIPAEYKKTTVAVAKRELGEALKGGAQIAGAMLGEGQSVTIR